MKHIKYEIYSMFLIPGTIIFTSIHKTLSYIFCPSEYKHVAIYFGKNLQTYLSDNRYNNDIEYIIHSDGTSTTAIDIHHFLQNKDEVALYYYAPYNKIDYVSMKMASKEACKYIGTPFSFFNHGLYCFEVVINSYQNVVKNLNFKPINILFNYYYISNSITNNIHFSFVFKSYKKLYFLKKYHKLKQVSC